MVGTIIVGTKCFGVLNLFSWDIWNKLQFCS